VERARILVVGGGIAGLSTAWWLARSGAREVTLVERCSELGREATAQNAAILRTADPDPVMEEWTCAGARFLLAPPPGFAAGPLVERVGLVVAIDPAGPNALEWERRLAERPRGEIEELSPAAAEHALPHLSPRGLRCFRMRDEGRIELAQLVDAFARGARALGVRIETGAAVVRLLPDARGVELAGGRVIEAEQVALSAGAWAHRLARAAGSRVTLTPTRRHLLVTAPDARIGPAWPVAWTDADSLYLRPERGGLLASACDEEPLEPERLSAEPRELERLRARLARHAPQFAGLSARAFWAGLRTHAADRRFAIGRDPDLARLVWVAGLGGHGITCAGVAGEIASGVLLGRELPRSLAGSVDPARLVRGGGAAGQAAGTAAVLRA
jgi:D-arginine dehydrogenase